MIQDRLENAVSYINLSDRFKKVFAYLQNTDYKKLPVGRYDLEDGVYFMVQHYATKPLEEGRFEAHQKYIDIQLILRGQEQIGYAPISELQEETAYEEARDVQFFQGEGSLLQVAEDSFCVFFPQDAHMPGIKGADEVEKIVVKIPV